MLYAVFCLRVEILRYVEKEYKAYYIFTFNINRSRIIFINHIPHHTTPHNILAYNTKKLR